VWDASDLLWHLTGVHQFWTYIIANRPLGPVAYEEAARPASHLALLAEFEVASAGLADALEATDPTDTAWSWSREQTAGFTFRRQAHEALIHRLDAELTANSVTPRDVQLSADGVLEVLDVMYGGTPDWGTFSPLPHYLTVTCSDTGDVTWVQLGRFTGTDPDDGVTYDEDDLNVVPKPEAEPEATIEGPAAALDAWLWRRGDDEAITVHGDRRIYDRFRTVVGNPIN
jgi:uncharacterized protein (TIGR03083 family)